MGSSMILRSQSNFAEEEAANATSCVRQLSGLLKSLFMSAIIAASSQSHRPDMLKALVDSLTPT